MIGSANALKAPFLLDALIDLLVTGEIAPETGRLVDIIA